MKVVKARIYLLTIPLTLSFSHYLKNHLHSKSIIVELISESGLSGYGEGIARPYVTGETATKSIAYIKNKLLPAIMFKALRVIETDVNPIKSLFFTNQFFPDTHNPAIIAWNAARTAVELALLDLLLGEQKKSLQCIIPAKINHVTYSGVVPLANHKTTAEIARRLRQLNLQYIKIKVGKSNDFKRIASIRDIMGPAVSIRLDANGAFQVKEAIQFIKAVEPYRIDCFEQPVKRGDNLALVKENSSIPIMADESIITCADAQDLITRRACDYFNLRITKCGGLYNTLFIAALAKPAGIKIQLGCLIGETAILSAAGRHVAAHFPEINFVEGSYSSLLLQEDIATKNIVFGIGGIAPALTEPGLGIQVKKDLLLKYAKRVVSIPSGLRL
ncbi:MAG: enolase [Elusimicrobia bacterium]|nr:enolase [Elusimicrobiota bacterium]